MRLRETMNTDDESVLLAEPPLAFLSTLSGNSWHGARVIAVMAAATISETRALVVLGILLPFTAIVAAMSATRPVQVAAVTMDATGIGLGGSGWSAHIVKVIPWSRVEAVEAWHPMPTYHSLGVHFVDSDGALRVVECRRLHPFMGLGLPDIRVEQFARFAGGKVAAVGGRNTPLPPRQSLVAPYARAWGIDMLLGVIALRLATNLDIAWIALTIGGVGTWMLFIRYCLARARPVVRRLASFEKGKMGS